MPTKHIDAAQWEQVEELTVALTKLTNQVVKESEVLKIIINRGLTNLSETEAAMQLEYKHRYNVIMYNRYPDDAWMSSHMERPSVNDVMEVISDSVPFMMYVYGKTNTGKSTFVKNVVKSVPDREIMVYDESPVPTPDIIENAWRDYHHGKSVVVVIHAADQLTAMNILFGPCKTKYLIEEPEEGFLNQQNKFN